ncbi:filaggrin-2 [Aplysia californica]|uniref:Filaggrin-2 n=1 Tax=Aplysia californica TaxID=6500 RepID=A0ABM1A8D3_APLCA|nr:filaggrin-2 [Aplysia californica]
METLQLWRKIAVIFLWTASFSLCTGDNAHHRCSMRHGNEPNLDDFSCESFWRCEHFEGHLTHCLDNHQFDFRTLQCLPNDKVWCQWQHIQQAEGGEEASGGGGRVTHAHHDMSPDSRMGRRQRRRHGHRGPGTHSPSDWYRNPDRSHDNYEDGDSHDDLQDLQYTSDVLEQWKEKQEDGDKYEDDYDHEYPSYDYYYEDGSSDYDSGKDKHYSAGSGDYDAHKGSEYDYKNWGHVCSSEYNHEPVVWDKHCRMFWRCDKYRGVKVECQPSELYDYHAKACRPHHHVNCREQRHHFLSSGPRHVTKLERGKDGTLVVHHFHRSGDFVAPDDTVPHMHGQARGGETTVVHHFHHESNTGMRRSGDLTLDSSGSPKGDHHVSKRRAEWPNQGTLSHWTNIIISKIGELSQRSPQAKSLSHHNGVHEVTALDQFSSVGDLVEKTREENFRQFLNRNELLRERIADGLRGDAVWRNWLSARGGDTTDDATGNSIEKGTYSATDHTHDSAGISSGHTGEVETGTSATEHADNATENVKGQGEGKGQGNGNGKRPPGKGRGMTITHTHDGVTHTHVFDESGVQIDNHSHRHAGVNDALAKDDQAEEGHDVTDKTVPSLEPQNVTRHEHDGSTHAHQIPPLTPHSFTHTHDGSTHTHLHHLPPLTPHTFTHTHDGSTHTHHHIPSLTPHTFTHTHDGSTHTHHQIPPLTPHTFTHTHDGSTHTHHISADGQFSDNTGHTHFAPHENDKTDRPRNSASHDGESFTHTHDGVTHTHDSDSHTHDNDSHTHDSDSHIHESDKHTHDSDSHTHNSGSYVHDSDSHTHDSVTHTHNGVAHTHNGFTHIHDSDSQTHDSESHTHNSVTHTHNGVRHTHYWNSDQTHADTPSPRKTSSGGAGENLNSAGSDRSEAQINGHPSYGVPSSSTARGDKLNVTFEPPSNTSSSDSDKSKSTPSARNHSNVPPNTRGSSVAATPSRRGHGNPRKRQAEESPNNSDGSYFRVVRKKLPGGWSVTHTHGGVAHSHFVNEDGTTRGRAHHKHDHKTTVRHQHSSGSVPSNGGGGGSWATMTRSHDGSSSHTSHGTEDDDFFESSGYSHSSQSHSSSSSFSHTHDGSTHTHYGNDDWE